GFAIPYEDDEPPFPLAALGERLAEGWPEETELLLEPGRALVGPAGVLLTRVLYRKKVHGHPFVVVDAGMTELLRPALYGAIHRIVPVLARPGPKVKVSVVGPICENADYLAREVHLPQVQRGELLAVLDVGAYGASMASQYNSRPRAPEVLLLDGVAWPVRRREPLGGLWEEEVVPAPLGRCGSQTP
ncbi:MAG: diaminopimelate decarboxylase, partial [Firmicutes bacterium]|nr:diaminopimelate decarboxylase [Bacillota bacterium]